MRKKIILYALGIFIGFLLLEGCFYHKSDEEYPVKDSCDTTNIRYSVEIKAILDEHCGFCHSETGSTGINLYDHEVISFLALDGNYTYGTLLSAVMHEGGASQMPNGGPKLPECEINKIAAWVHDGAPDN